MVDLRCGQIEAVYAIFGDAAALEQVKVSAVAAPDVEKRARNPYSPQEAVELYPVQDFLALASDHGDLFRSVICVIGAGVDDTKFGRGRSRVKPYCFALLAAPEMPFIATGLQFIIMSAGKKGPVHGPAYRAGCNVLGRYFGSIGTEPEECSLRPDQLQGVVPP